MKVSEFFKKEFEKIGVELIPAGNKVYVISNDYDINEEVDIYGAFVGLMAGLFKDPKEKAIAEVVDGFAFFCENELNIDEVTSEVTETIKAQVKKFKKTFERS